MEEEPETGDDLLTQLGVSDSLRVIVARTAMEYEATGDWVSFDTLAYEAVESNKPIDITEVFGLPSAIGGAWADEKISLTGLGLLEAETAPIVAKTMARLAAICAERKFRLRGDASLGRTDLVATYGFSQEEALRARDLIQLIPGVFGGGNLGDDWSLTLSRGALDYLKVQTVDDLRRVFETKALERIRQQQASMATPVPFNMGTVFKEEPLFESDTESRGAIDDPATTEVDEAIDNRRLRYSQPGTYLSQALGPDNIERIVVALDTGLDPMFLAVVARWWQLESYLRQLLYIVLRSRAGVEWADELGGPVAERAQSVSRLGYMASADDDYPLAHLDVRRLFHLLTEHWSATRHGIGLSPVSWRGRVEELSAIRNRMAHGRRPHSDDVLRIEQTLRDLEVSARTTLQAYVTYSNLDPSIEDPVADAWVRLQHPSAHLVEHGRRNKGIHFELQHSVLPWAVTTSPATGEVGRFWAMQVVCEDRHIDLASFVAESAVEVSTRWIGHILSPSPTCLVLTFPMVDDPTEVSDAIGRCLEAVFVSARPGREPGGRLAAARSAKSYDSRVDVEGVLSVLWGLTMSDPITLFSA